MQDLFIFAHIPKTSGEVMKRNIEQSLPKNAMIRTSYEYFEPYFDIIHNKNEFYNGHTQFHQYIQLLSDDQKRKVKLIAGHNAYYGIHELFPQQAKYITFLREPMARTISLYNFEKMAWDIYSKKDNLNIFEVNFLTRITDNFLINNQLPSFEQWFYEIYDIKIPFYYTMSRYLKQLGFSAEGEQLLNLFHFIGITETHDQDALYLYRQLKVKQLNADKNASPNFITVKNLSKNIIQDINKKNAEDIELYHLGRKKNILFKKKNKFYYYLSLKNRFKKILNLG